MNILRRKKKTNIDKPVTLEDFKNLDAWLSNKATTYPVSAIKLEDVILPSGTFIADNYNWMPPSGTYTDWDYLFYTRDCYVREFTCSYCKTRIVLDLKSVKDKISVLKCPNCGAAI